MTHDTHPTPTTHTHTPHPKFGGCEEDLSKKTAPDGTNRHTDILTYPHTDGHGDSMTHPAKRAESVKMQIFMSYLVIIHQLTLET